MSALHHDSPDFRRQFQKDRAVNLTFRACCPSTWIISLYRNLHFRMADIESSQTYAASLLGLPPEVRLKLYKILTTDGKITVQGGVRKSGPQPSKPWLLGSIAIWNLKSAVSITQVSKQWRSESLPIFQQRTIKLIGLNQNLYETEPELVPSQFIKCITHLEIENPFLPLRFHDYLPGLQHITIYYGRHFLTRTDTLKRVCESEDFLT